MFVCCFQAYSVSQQVKNSRFRLFVISGVNASGKICGFPTAIFALSCNSQECSHTNSYCEWPRGVMKIIANFNGNERINAASNISCKNHCHSLAVTIILLYEFHSLLRLMSICCMLTVL